MDSKDRILVKETPLAQQVSGYNNYNKKGPTYESECLDEFESVFGVFSDIYSVVDDGCE